MTRTKIYFYKLTTDDGGAPCVENGLLSLAICKPAIRRTAEPGDLIFGFAANALHSDNRLVYIAQVTGKICDGMYYKDSRFAGRTDRIYKWRRDHFDWRKGAAHHGPKDLVHDLGEQPDYQNAYVLLSMDFKYFGKDGTADYKREFPQLKGAVKNLGRGHRVWLTEQLRQELIQLQAQVWAKFKRKVVGKPTSAPQKDACHRSRSCGVLDGSETL